jgi:hypothetical protein
MNLSQIRKNQTNLVMNATWTDDPTYRRVYILTENGWKWEDAKYQFHFSQTVSKDNVDYYLQFRPGVHYPIGTYVLVPDDTGSELNLTDEELQHPFKQPIDKRTQWWMIVDRDNANAFVRYNILQCNWDFRWVYDGKIYNSFGIIRSAQSYTSGVWRAEKTISLDNLTGCWLPDTYLLFGDKLKDLGLDDTRTLVHDQRFLLTTNDLNPKVYQITKIIEVSPKGILKLSLKQDEYNSKRDNIELKVCDYYTNEGDMTSITPNNSILDRAFTITELFMDDKDELINQNMIVNNTIQCGKRYFYQAILSNDSIPCVWNIELQDDLGQYTEDEKQYYERLIKLVNYNDNIVEVKPGKAGSLVGKEFKLNASREDGAYIASIDLEVSK